MSIFQKPDPMFARFVAGRTDLAFDYVAWERIANLKGQDGGDLLMWGGPTVAAAA